MTESIHLFLTPGVANVLDIAATSLFAIYLVLQIFHHKFMWYVYIPSCVAAAISFFDSATWAFAALNVYYIVMGVTGIINWKRDAAAAAEHKGAIILNKIKPRNLWISAGIVAVLNPILYFLLTALGDPNPLLDTFTTSLSVIGTWWLTKSYIQQWWIWIVADVFAIWMNVNLGKTAFVIQFILCILSSCQGLWLWNKKGKYLTE